jgi:hypothetical protein
MLLDTLKKAVEYILSQINLQFPDSININWDSSDLI